MTTAKTLRPPLLLALALAPAGSAWAQQFPPGPEALPSRPCDPHTFFVEAPLGAPDLPTGFENTLRSVLTNEVRSRTARWLCTPSESGCLAHYNAYPPHAVVTPVLPARSSHARTTGHRRFFRVYFQDNRWDPVHGYSKIPVRPEAGCEVVSRIREIAATAIGRSAPISCVTTPIFGGSITHVTFRTSCTQWTLLSELRIGRECPVRAMGAEENALDPSLPLGRWHWDALGVDASPPPINATKKGATPVLSLIDSGIRPSEGGTLGVLSQSSFRGTVMGPRARRWNGTFASGLFEQNPHGMHMAALARHLAPTARLRSSWIIDQRGVGSLAELARAIDEALHQDPSLPLVLQMSLGLPPELTQHAVLSQEILPNQTCGTWEDGAGESVRYALHVARAHDEAGIRPVMAVAAAGNRPAHFGPYDPGTYYYWTLPSYRHPNSCGSLDPGAPQRFFPADLSNVLSCGPGLAGSHPTVLAVGAVDHQDRPGVLSLPGAETPLVAPGERVYAFRPGLPAQEGGLRCQTHVGLGEYYESPHALTGSSVSAALVAGAAVRAQGIRMGRAEAPLRAAALERLLYLTGEPLCRTTSNGTPVRRLSVARLERALTLCPSLVTCAASGARVTPSTVNECASALTACGFGSSPIAPVCPPRGPADRLAWAPGYHAHVASCAGPGSVCGGVEPGCVLGNQAPTTIGGPPTVSDQSTGILGPQPDQPTCPDCKMVLSPTDVTFHLELSAGYEPGTQFYDPQVIVTNEYGDTLEGGLVLERYTNPLDWAPGKAIVLRVPLAELSGIPTHLDAYRNVKARLDVTVRTPAPPDNPTERGRGRTTSPLDVQLP